MTSTNFEQMSLIEKGMVLVSKGKHLTQVKEGKFLMNLYSIGDLFVELFYSINSNKVERIELMTDLSRIDMYIDQTLGNTEVDFSQYSYN